MRYDLDGDGSTVGDERLKLPRLAPLTYGAEGQCRRQFANLGTVSARLGIAHRDDSEIAHDNTGVLDGGDVLDASVWFAPSASLRFTAYGRNLLGETFRRSHFDLTGLVESTYSPLKEGRGDRGGGPVELPVAATPRLPREAGTRTAVADELGRSAFGGHAP